MRLTGFNWLSYWAIPLFSAVIWVAMILAMLIHWCASGRPHYPSMKPTQTIAYISDVGASSYKPLFIAMGTISVVTFDFAFIAERWLRHRGRLIKNTATSQKILAGFSIAFAIIGAMGLICLTIFDTLHHKNLHDLFIAFFIGGYVISAVFICAEYHRLGVFYRHHTALRKSFWMKLFFIIVEIALAIAFGALNKAKKWNSAACVEWAIAFVYTFWVLSFVVDFLPVMEDNHDPTDERMLPAVAEANA